MPGSIKRLCLLGAAVAAFAPTVAVAQSPGCARALRQANQLSGQARTAALRGVAANCPRDSAGQAAARLAGPAPPPGPSAAERARIAEEQRQRENARREQARREEARREQARREQAGREDARRAQAQREEAARRAEAWRQEQARQRQREADARRQPAPSATTARYIDVVNRCNVTVRFRLVYTQLGQFRQPAAIDSSWTVDASRSIRLTAGGVYLQADNSLAYFNIVSPNWNYPANAQTRLFQYGGQTMTMYPIPMTINANGAYEVRLC